MPDARDVDVDSVAVDPDYCHRCGTELDVREFEDVEQPWCPDCELVLSRSPIPAVHVVVHDDDSVLVLDEPIPQHEGVLSLPGGHARYDEGPKEAVVRELAEETALSASPDDLRFVTTLHVEFPGAAFYFLTYAVERAAVAGDPTPEFADGDASFVPAASLRADPDRIRDTDLARIERALDG